MDARCQDTDVYGLVFIGLAAGAPNGWKRMPANEVVTEWTGSNT